MSDPIERYLDELRRRLPYPAPRIIEETRSHLQEAAERARDQGMTAEESQEQAIASYGPVDGVVAAVLREGSPLMSPSFVRWIRPAALLLSLPTAVFIFVNVIEKLAGTDGGPSVFGTTFDPWSSQLSNLIVFGPMVAFLLVVASTVRVRREPEVRGFAATVELRMARPTFWVAVVVSLVAASVVAYGLAENYGEWRDFHNMNWTCTTEAGRQICYEGFRAPPP